MARFTVDFGALIAGAARELARHNPAVNADDAEWALGMELAFGDHETLLEKVPDGTRHLRVRLSDSVVAAAARALEIRPV